MNPKSKIVKIGVAAILSLTLLVATSQRANAEFLDPFEAMVEASLNTIETLILGLSDDIGEMADRIIVMAGEIGIMADRIVHTEELIVSLVENGGISSLITSPAEGDVVYRTVPVQITHTGDQTDYLLYISNNADMSAATNALVQNNDTSDAWSRVPDFATGDKLYIAIRTVGTTSSDYSNTVMVNLQ